MDNSVSSIPQSEEDQEVLVTLAEALEAFTKDYMVQVSSSSVVEHWGLAWRSEVRSLNTLSAGHYFGGPGGLHKGLHGAGKRLVS